MGQGQRLQIATRRRALTLAGRQGRLPECLEPINHQLVLSVGLRAVRFHDGEGAVEEDWIGRRRLGRLRQRGLLLPLVALLGLL